MRVLVGSGARVCEGWADLGASDGVRSGLGGGGWLVLRVLVRERASWAEV